MPIEEKYDKLYDSMILADVTTMAFLKEQGLVDQYFNYSAKVTKKMVPTLMGTAFKLVKMLAPGRAFKQAVENFIPILQVQEPVSNINIVSLSDREAIFTIKNSITLKKYRDMMNKSGLHLDLTEIMEHTIRTQKEMAKDFGIDYTVQIKEDGWTYIVKLL